MVALEPKGTLTLRFEWLNKDAPPPPKPVGKEPEQDFAGSFKKRGLGGGLGDGRRPSGEAVAPVPPSSGPASGPASPELPRASKPSVVSGVVVDGLPAAPACVPLAAPSQTPSQSAACTEAPVAAPASRGGWFGMGAEEPAPSSEFSRSSPPNGRRMKRSSTASESGMAESSINRSEGSIRSRQSSRRSRSPTGKVGDPSASLPPQPQMIAAKLTRRYEHLHAQVGDPSAPSRSGKLEGLVVSVIEAQLTEKLEKQLHEQRLQLAADRTQIEHQTAELRSQAATMQQQANQMQQQSNALEQSLAAVQAVGLQQAAALNGVLGQLKELQQNMAAGSPARSDSGPRSAALSA